MYWQNKLHAIRARFGLKDHELRTPYTTWLPILKKIEARFVIKTNSNNHFNNWILHLKSTLVAQQADNITDWKKVLPDCAQYYLILVGKVPSNKHYVFDCSRRALELLVDNNRDSHFYVVDKKYGWMLVLERDERYYKVKGYKLLVAPTTGI